MDFEREILEIKERLRVAEKDGRNPIAIQGKFDIVFGLIEDLRIKITDRLSRFDNIQPKQENIIKTKKKAGRPKLGGVKNV